MLLEGRDFGRLNRELGNFRTGLKGMRVKVLNGVLGKIG